MVKSLCKWKKKEVENHLHELWHIVDKPRHICKDCARASHTKGYLCKPIKLPHDTHSDNKG
ncbi:hypothetical protein RGQ13_11560 [Thalassotalea psychrophila]|uniref:Uncharacterized protein n=1 Tax=Thalassotalea psychrophila TaxID=3065647 RepID=A0ABY9TPR2_9GAMM|nr:hypothetical protein RGQ13_11560 [Colwelliaceae bacterium SQ149]